MSTLVCLERLNAQLVGDGHEHFKDGHEGGDLAEVAAADHLGVDLQAPLVVLARYAAADLVESAEDVLGELGRRQDVRFLHQMLMKKKKKPEQENKSVSGSYCLLSQLVVQVSQTFGCVVKFPFRLLKNKHL